MLTLHLIRHAETQPTAHSGRDFDRELLPQGIAQANLLGHVMSVHHIDPGFFLVSAAMRTQQTFSIISKHLPELCNHSILQELYHAGRNTLMQIVSAQEHPILTLIGHNNGISEFAQMLSGEAHYFNTCELLTLKFALPSWAHLASETGIPEFRYSPVVFEP